MSLRLLFVISLLFVYNCAQPNSPRTTSEVPATPAAQKSSPTVTLLIRAQDFPKQAELENIVESLRHLQKTQEVTIKTFQPKSSSFSMMLEWDKGNLPELTRMIQDNMAAFHCPVSCELKADILNISPLHPEANPQTSVPGNNITSQEESAESTAPANTKLVIKLVEFDDVDTLAALKEKIIAQGKAIMDIAQIRHPTSRSCHIFVRGAEGDKETIVNFIYSHLKDDPVTIDVRGDNIFISPKLFD